MKKEKQFLRLFSLFLIALFLFFPLFIQKGNATEEKAGGNISDIELYPGGMPFGVKIITKGLTVVKFTDSHGKNSSSAYEAGIRAGDIITRVNGNKISSIEDFVYQVNKNGGNKMNVTILRNDKELIFSVLPKYSQDEGKYKTGIWVKDSTSGIGTVTFVNPETNVFAGLGHAICDSSTGKIIPLTRGIVMDVSINGVKKGQIGTAGELKGTFEEKKIGTLIKNSSSGVFGVLSCDNVVYPEKAMKPCPKEEIKEGDAYIWCTLDESGPQKYKIQISNIDLSNSNVKNFRVKVVDEKLLEKSGGIVQGMSGSPIIQNGRIIGAVTHVLINDPTSGYGIFIENMLSSIPDILK